jgi:signal transduction histidine kinase
MRERAELMGGHFAAHKGANGGLVVQVRVPATRRVDSKQDVAV